jgi:hypothetical protein
MEQAKPGPVAGIPKHYRCPKVAHKPKIDGNLQKGFWLRSHWTDAFVDIEGSLKPAPLLRTRVKMAWNGDYFFIGADLEEPHLWATLTQHDSVIFHDNDFEVFIDPDGDAKRYFEFEINAHNTTWDLYLDRAYRDKGNADNSWESHAITAVDLQGKLNDPSDKDKGWSVEIAFPWECFRANGGMPCPPRPGDVWRVNFSRVQWELDVVKGRYVKRPNRPEANWVWTPQGVIDMHQPEHWGYVEFVE